MVSISTKLSRPGDSYSSSFATSIFNSTGSSSLSYICDTFIANVRIHRARFEAGHPSALRSPMNAGRFETRKKV